MLGGAPKPPRSKETKESRTKRAADPETDVAVPEVGSAPVAGGRPEVLWIVPPGTAAEDTGLTLAKRPRRTISRRPIVVLVIAILHPLPHVTRHIVKAERIGLERSDR